LERHPLDQELERLHPESWGWALSCVGGDSDLAREALQTAYARILSGSAVSEGRSSIRTWLFGVIRLTALEELRRHRRATARRDGDDAIELIDPAPGPDVITERAERAEALRRALTKLSRRQREVIQLVFYHGLTIEEAATVMQVSPGSASTHYKRGKTGLAATLAHLREDVA
jgi:RNA polymerase sigma factor (sigma-70 family)